jgi:putative addiction module component (TIGR02574 family)
MFIPGLPAQPAVDSRDGNGSTQRGPKTIGLRHLTRRCVCVSEKLRHNERMATFDIANLSFEERLRLLDKLWESLSRTPEAIPLTEAQREELDRRLNELDREGPVGIPWDDVLARIRGRAQ